MIPSSVQIEGTARTFKKEVQQTVRQKFKNILSSLCSANDADFNLEYQEGSPPVTYNHSSCIEGALTTVKELIKESNIVYPHPPVMGSEDFGYYSEKIPACFIALGAGNKEKGIVKMCHDPHFDVDENCILSGMLFNTCLALKFE